MSNELIAAQGMSISDMMGIPTMGVHPHHLT
jgi:hypothetical protein